MVVSKLELYELLRKADGADVDFLREGVRTLAQALMAVEVSTQIGAEHGQRTPERVTHRNGYRPRDWDTRVGTVELQIPKLAMRCVKRRLGPVSGHRGVAAQRVGAGPTTGQARTA